MRNSIKAVCAAGSTALIMAGSAMAQSVPILGITFATLEDATMDDGACGTAATAVCSTIASEFNGDKQFIQRQIKKGNDIFIQTIIKDVGFESQDFVKIQFGGGSNPANKGLASKLSVFEGNGATAAAVSTHINGGITGYNAAQENFVAESTIMSGWAETTAADSSADLTVDLGVGRTDATSYDGFVSKFNVVATMTGTTNTLVSLSADQTVELSNAQTVTIGGVPTVQPDQQVFFTAIKAATGESHDGAVSVEALDQPGYNFGGVGTGQVRYNQDDRIQAVWVGQRLAGVGNFSVQSMSNFDVATYGTPAQPNITTRYDLTEVTTFDWTGGSKIGSEFGTAPAF